MVIKSPIKSGKKNIKITNSINTPTEGIAIFTAILYNLRKIFRSNLI